MEMLDVVDEYGNPTGQVVERNQAHLEGIMHRTSHVWFLRKRNDIVQILLQKRSMNKDSHPGCYDISSAGHIPAGFDYKESAVREIKEELGIIVDTEELICCGDRTVVWDDYFYGKPFHDRQFSRVFFIWKDLDEEDFFLQKEEVDSVHWIDFEECMTAVKENKINHCIFAGELDMVRAAIDPDKIILYGSEYGTAKQYALRLSQMTGLPSVSFGEAEHLQDYTEIVYIGALYAGGVKGLKQTAHKIQPDTKLIIVTVGLADVADEGNIRHIREALRQQVSKEQYEKAAIFHLRGGIDYQKLSFVHRTMMAMLYKKAQKLPEEKKNAEVRAMIDTYGQQVDFTDYDALKEIARKIKEEDR